MLKRIIKKLIDLLVTPYYKKKTTDYWWTLKERCKKGGWLARFSYLKYHKYEDKYNAFIPVETQFKGIPTFPHGINGIYISSGAIIGENVIIYHQVTIGSNTLLNSKHAGAPIIGNNVYIGCGAKIIGNVRIGDNVRIGANCIVTEDIKSNSTVVSQKPRIIEKFEQNNLFVEYLDYKKNSD